MTAVVTLGESVIAFVATTLGPLAEATTFERSVAGAEGPGPHPLSPPHLARPGRLLPGRSCPLRRAPSP